MFNRIRYAAKVLSSGKITPEEYAGIAFVEEKPLAISKVSIYIGWAVELVVLSFGIGLIVVPSFLYFLPAKTATDIVHITGVASALLAFLSMNLINQVHKKIGSQLQIGLRVAPYFGHRIVDAIRTLRG